MGGAQPLAAVMAGAHCIAIECQESRIEKRLETRYLDRRATSVDEALDIIRAADAPISVGLLGNAAEILPEMVRRGIRPDALTDQTSAHDPVNGYLPIGWTVEQWVERRERDPRAVEHAARASMAVHVEAMLAFREMGVPTFDYGNNIRQVAKDEGVERAFDFPGFVPAYVGRCLPRHLPVTRALIGRSEDIYRTTKRWKGLIPDDPTSTLARHGARAHAFQGCRQICWVGPGKAGAARTQREVASASVKAPIVIGRTISTADGRKTMRERGDAGRPRRGVGRAAITPCSIRLRATGVACTMGARRQGYSSMQAWDLAAGSEAAGGGSTGAGDDPGRA